ncbi:MAG: VCBS repeat-containing protein [Pirellulaceae bacterium]
MITMTPNIRRQYYYYRTSFCQLESRLVLSAIGFAAQELIASEANGAADVFAADLDGDGDLDVLSASAGDNKIAWYPNTDGKGNFGPQRVITNSALGAVFVEAADFDGDGDLDVLAASRDDDTVAWFENLDGQGTFGSKRVISANSREARSATAADLDGDGDLDVLVASYETGVAWFRNTDGQGAFGDSSVIDSGLRNFFVVAEDLDGDHDLDVVKTSVSDGVIWYENISAEGVFRERRSLSGGSQRLTFATADLDGDGDFDIVGASYPIVLNWNDGAGNFDATALFAVTDGEITDLVSSDSIATADVDNDGDIDVVGDNGWYENTPDDYVFHDFKSWGRKSVVEVADLDGDGDPDVLRASQFGDDISWRENLDGQGNFSAPRRIARTAADAGGMVAADLDDDGDIDLLLHASSSKYSNSKIVWIEKTAESFGSAESLTNTSYPALGLNRNSYTLADLNSDGSPDLIYISRLGASWLDPQLIEIVPSVTGGARFPSP